jgi:hypothetical protein
MDEKKGTILMLTLFACLLSACAGASDPGGGKLGKEFSLTPGQSAAIDGENMQVKFVQVLEDSRCPRGARCVWAGQVRCALEMVQGNVTQQVVLTQPGLTDEYVEETYGGYRFAFKVEPYPEANKAIADDQYRLRLTIVVSKRNVRL